MGARLVKLTGGEPLLREDIADIYGGIVSQGFHVMIETNGTVFPKDLAYEMREHPPVQVSVSLDSADPASHDAFRRAEGSWERAVDFIRDSAAKGINVQVIMSTHSYEIGDVAKMTELLEELGVKSLKINPVMPLGRGSQFHVEDPVDVSTQLRFAEDVFSRFGKGVWVDVPHAFVPLHRLPDAGRCSILNLIGILPNADVSFCGIGLSRPELILGSMRNESMRDIWESSPALARLRDIVPDGLEGICQSCIHRNSCLGHCVMENYVLGGSISSPSELCRAAEQQGLFPKSRLKGSYASG